MNLDPDKVAESRNFITPYALPFYIYCKQNPNCTKIFSPILGVIVGLVTLTVIIAGICECALKAIICFGMSLFCCQNKLQAGFIFITASVLGTLFCLPFVLIDTIKAIWGLICNTQKFCDNNISTINKGLKANIRISTAIEKFNHKE